MKINILYSLGKICTLAVVLFFMQSCNKNNELTNKDKQGEVILKVSPLVAPFSDENVKGRASIKDPESYISSLELSKDLIMISTLTPILENEPNSNIKSADVGGNRADVQSTSLRNGVVYKLIVYNADGTYRTFRNYKYGSPNLTDELSLPINKTYTFLAYSLSSTDFSDLDNAFPDSTVSLSQAKIIVNNNPDLLVYKETLAVDEANNNLGIVFKHQFNEITTIIDASLSGYSIDPSSLQTRFNIARNSATISFSNMQQVNSANGGFQFDLNGSESYNFTTANNVSNSIATSKTSILINTDANTNLFSVINIKVGDVTRSIPNPFSSGVTLLPGYKYRLEVKIIPRDTTLIHEGKPAVLLGGQIWMRYSLGSNGDRDDLTGSRADIPGIDIHGAYYQWGKKLPGINANSKTTNSNWDNNGISGQMGLSYFNRWNSGTATSPVRGLEDPCPPGFRLPVPKDFETLLTYIENDYRKFVNAINTAQYALQLTSKFNANAKLTFAASGYGYMGNDDGSYNVGFGGLYSNYNQVHLKTSSYGTQTPTLVNSSGAPGGTAYQTRYVLYSPVAGSTGANRIMTYPGSPRVSSPVNAHPVRCIAISNASIVKINEREIHSGGNNNVNF